MRKRKGEEEKEGGREGGEGFHSCCSAVFPLIGGFGCTPSSLGKLSKKHGYLEIWVARGHARITREEDKKKVLVTRM